MAYVQLKPGNSVSESELLAHAEQHIAERAAVPKRIHVIEAMPVTPVGKIFKPELRQREVLDVAQAVLRNWGGDPGATLSVSQDSRRGLLLSVRTRATPEALAALRQQLGAYTFAFELIGD